jgi:methyltransferase (TIGR00027 family)
MSGGELAEVSRTAIGVALVRAVESQRPDRLFDDPFAGRFLAAAPDYVNERAERARSFGTTGPSPMSVALAAHIAVRTRFYDTYLLQATAEGCRQVVLLAAGLDARGYRLAFEKGVRLFELDLPPVLSFKDKVLAGQAPTCERIAVPVDLSQEWAEPLRRAGFDPAAPTAWLIEGLLIYLTRHETVRLLDTVNALSAPGSRVSFEQSVATRTAGGVEHYKNIGQMTDIVALWKGGLGEDAVAFLERRGWQAGSVDRKATAESYGRTDPGRNPGEFVLGVKSR